MMELKICYIFLSAGLKSDSIQKKVIAQIDGMNANGIDCRGAFFTGEVQERVKLRENIDLIPYPQTNRKYFNVIWQKRALIKSITKFAENELQQNELIYLRYPGVTYNLYRFVRKFRNSVISEHQAKEIEEFKSARNEHPFGFKPSKFISFFLYQFWPVFNEKLWGKYYSRCLMAKVAVTNEIADYHRKNCKNVWVIANGIETAKYKVRTVPEFDKELRILFLKGTSGLAPWNGLDRLIRSLDAFKPLGTKIKLIICGSKIPGEIPERDYIDHRGYVEGAELDQLFSEVHLGCSTLCLFRKQLNEAAVLKAREYFTRGLPFIYAYTDPDIDESEHINEYMMKVSNDDKLIDMNQVLLFYEHINKDISQAHKMRAFAEKRLDWNYKMNLLKINLVNLGNPKRESIYTY